MKTLISTLVILATLVQGTAFAGNTRDVSKDGTTRIESSKKTPNEVSKARKVVVKKTTTKEVKQKSSRPAPLSSKELDHYSKLQQKVQASKHLDAKAGDRALNGSELGEVNAILSGA